MIIYGSRSVHLKSTQADKITCPNCQTENSLILSVFGKHAHVFWIPLFPIGKKGFSQCQHCKQVLETREMPEQIKTAYKILKKDSKYRVWQYSGLIAFLVLFVIPWGLILKGK